MSSRNIFYTINNSSSSPTSLTWRDDASTFGLFSQHTCVSIVQSRLGAYRRFLPAWAPLACAATTRPSELAGGMQMSGEEVGEKVGGMVVLPSRVGAIMIPLQQCECH